MNPLQNYKVLDLSNNYCGPLCAEILGDLGAEVIKFENPATGGDTARYTAPIQDGVASYYLATCRGKKSVIIDFRNAQHRELFLKMVKEADIVVENFRPGSMEKFGLDYENLKAVNPKIIMTSISGYGQDGPWAKRGAYDNAIQAASGIMSVTGEPGQGPMKVGISMSDVVSGLWGAIATLAAIARYERTGEGAHIDLAMLDSMLQVQDILVTRYMFDGKTPKSNGNKHILVCPSMPVPCKNDESVLIVLPMQEQFESFCIGIGHPELPKDPRFDTMKHRVENRDDLEPLLCSITSEWDADDLCAILEERKLTYSKINNIPQVLELDQVKHRQVLAEVKWPGNDRTFHVGATPVHMTGMERPMSYRAAPLGADTMEVFSQYVSEEEVHNMFDSYLERLPAIIADKIK